MFLPIVDCLFLMVELGIYRDRAQTSGPKKLQCELYLRVQGRS